MLMQFLSAVCSGFVFQRMTLISCDPQCTQLCKFLGQHCWESDGVNEANTLPCYLLLMCEGEKEGKESLLKIIIKKLCMDGM